MKKLPEDVRKRLIISKYFKAAKKKMQPGYAYSIDDLLPVDYMSDNDILAVMARLDNHPLIAIDSDFPKKWRLK